MHATSAQLWTVRYQNLSLVSALLVHALVAALVTGRVEDVVLEAVGALVVCCFLVCMPVVLALGEHLEGVNMNKYVQSTERKYSDAVMHGMHE